MRPCWCQDSSAMWTAKKKVDIFGIFCKEIGFYCKIINIYPLKKRF